ncbi:MAG: AAA family ATPase [Methylococcales bacterium]|nr:AAA family ATPase [Methylobacter sp.]MDP2426564.1 AAA family ATPase [Methylobacter sp.]MDP3056729.1 AAA family ATPase [Methylobacter sp.]MDP3360923.1 AAA family ATPase [Methylobacter sp.]MDZ4157903.1 AAA family ATPase [Methylococcales bacterium]
MLTQTYSHALTLWQNAVAQFQQANMPVNSEQKDSNYVKPKQKPVPDNGFQHGTDIEPIVQLWLLRLLVPLECHRKFINKNDYDNDEIAKVLGLKAETNETFKESVEKTLRIALDMQTDEDKNDDTPPFDPKQALRQIKQRYTQATHNADYAVLPQPLADNIRQLAAQIGLSPAEAHILAFAIIIRTDRLLDDACDWLGREMNTLKLYHVLSVLLGFPQAEIREALSSRSMLSQTSLMVVREHRGELGHKLDLLSNNFANRLMTETGSPVDWLRDMIVPSLAPVLSLADYPHLDEQLDFLLPYLQQALNSGKKGINVFFYGTPGTGKTQLTRVLAALMDCPLYEIASEDDDGDPVNGVQRLRAFRAAQVFFQHSPALMLFDEVEDVFNDGDGLFGGKSTAQTRKAWMNRLLEGNPVPTFWLGNSINSVDPAFIRRFDWVIELPVPPKVQRERIIRASCSEVLNDQAIKRLAACEDLAPAVVTRAAQVIGSLQGQFPPERLSTALQQMMDKTLQAQGHPGLNSDNAVRLPDFYDPELLNCDADLTQIAQGIQQHGSARLCLFGPPGTGKSAYSRWLADYLDKPLHVKRGSDLLSMWVGGTEKNIARIFKEAEQDNAVLLIDEVDSFLQDRNSSQHSWEITGVNEMLTRMEAYNGVFIASTNRLDGLDAASLRRFDLKVKFDALKPQQAWKLLLSHCQALGLPEPDASLQRRLQTLDGLTPGDFAVLERQHRFRPITDVTALIDALYAKCALKTPLQRQPMGFT